MSPDTRTRFSQTMLISALASVVLLGIAVPGAAQDEVYDLGTNVSTQDILAANSDTVHIAWTVGTVLYYGRIVNNALTGKVQVASGINTIFWRPYISVQPDGSSVHIAWTTGGQGNTLMHSWTTGGGWETETVLRAPSTQWLTQACCAIDSSDVLHVMFCIWNNVSGDEWSTIFYMRRLADGRWEDKRMFTPETPEFKHPMLFVASNGRVHATWDVAGKLGSDSYDAYYCSTPSGGELDYADRVKLPKRPDTDVSGYGDLYVDHEGVVHRSIGGWSNTQRKMCIDHTKKPVGGSFETPTRPSKGFLNIGEGDPVPAVVASEDGQIVVAWGQIGADGSNTVKASFYDPGKGDWSLTTIDPAAGIPQSPNSYRVAMTRTSSRILLVWRGGNGHLKLGVLSFDGSPPPPPGEEPPVASFYATPSAGPAPLDVTFDASASSDADGTIVTYLWDFGDGASSDGPVVTHTYTTSGTFRASLTVTDDDGNEGSASEEIIVGEATDPPVADFRFSPSIGIFPCEITFDGSASHDPDGRVVAYHWSFGDGGRGSGKVIRHTFMRWGTFPVVLTVEDDAGATASKLRTIEILRLFQPLSIRWESHKDESLFQTRYVNNVTWERNPANDALGVEIVLQRVWRKEAREADASFKPVGEVTADVYSFIDKSAEAEETYVYTVTVLDNLGHESPIVGGGSGSGLLQPDRRSLPLYQRGSLGRK